MHTSDQGFPSTPGPLLQACAVPFRASEAGREFCLITSISKGRWGFPKGIIDPGETPIETALKEAYEEAGLRGEIIGDALGSYPDFKWDTSLEVTGYLMAVSESLDEWLEMRLRKRCWVSAAEAKRLIANSGQRQFLRVALQRLG